MLSQLYLALFLGLIPLPSKIQDDIIPYVCFFPPFLLPISREIIPL
jgi:hypothetical protein